MQDVSLIRRIDNTGIPLLLARLVLGGMFLYMGTAKLFDPAANFLKQVKLYNILPLDPPFLLNLTAVTLPWLEILAGALLILGVCIRGSALVLAGMLVTFIPALFARALDISAAQGIGLCSVAFDCGCGTGERNTCMKMLENTGLLALSMVALFSRSRAWCLSPKLARGRSLNGVETPAPDAAAS